jgi:hypothetical protein
LSEDEDQDNERPGVISAPLSPAAVAAEAERLRILREIQIRTQGAKTDSFADGVR